MIVLVVKGMRTLDRLRRKLLPSSRNRDIFNVLFGGLNNAPVVKGADDGPKDGGRQSTAGASKTIQSYCPISLFLEIGGPNIWGLYEGR